MKRIIAFAVFACMAIGLFACAPEKENGFVKLDREAIGKGAGLNSVDVFGDEALVLVYSYGEEIEEPYRLELWDLERNELKKSIDFSIEGDYGCSADFDDAGMIVVTKWGPEDRRLTTAYDRELNKLDNYVPSRPHPEDKYNALGVTDFWQDDNYAYYDVGTTRSMIFYDQPDKVFFTETGSAYGAAEDGMRIVFCREDEGGRYYDIADYSKGGMINHAALSAKRAGYYDAFAGECRMNEKYVVTVLSFEEERDYSEPEEPEEPDYSSDISESSEEISSSEESGESSEEISSSGEAESEIDDGSEGGSSGTDESSESSDSSELSDGGESSVGSEDSAEPQPAPAYEVEEITEDGFEDGGEDCDCGDGEYYEEDVNSVTEIWFWDYTVGASETAEDGAIYSMTLDEVEQKTKDRAQQMSDKYGLNIIINPEERTEENGISSLENNDTFVPGYLYLDTLDETLGKFPQGMFVEAKEGGEFDDFRIYIGKRITDDFSAAFCGNSNGVLYIAMTTSSFTESNISHEMMHAFEYRMDNIWHQWNKLNPRGFEYYGDPHEADNTEYNDDYFVRGYGQANQLEDRATIFEELFTAGTNEYLENWWYAEKPGVVAKAKFLCAEIRKAYPSVAAVDEAVWERWIRGL